MGLLQTDKNRHRCTLVEGSKTSSQDLKQSTWECWLQLLIGHGTKVSVMSKQCDWMWRGHHGEHTRSYRLCCYVGAGTVLTSVCYTWKDIWLHKELSKETIMSRHCGSSACRGFPLLLQLHGTAQAGCHSRTLPHPDTWEFAQALRIFTQHLMTTPAHLTRQKRTLSGVRTCQPHVISPASLGFYSTKLATWVKEGAPSDPGWCQWS